VASLGLSRRRPQGASEHQLEAGSADGAYAHALTVEEVAHRFEGDLVGGLSEEEASDRLRRTGPNILERARRPPYAQIAIRQVKDPLVALLIVAASVSAAVGESLDAGIIAAIVLLNGALGFFEELGAERAIIALRESVPLEASVVRAGIERIIPAEEVVQGDLLVVREGGRVPADGRLVSGEAVSADEAPLTGESVPVEKSTAPVALATPLAERSAMVFAGTAITRGQGRVLVTAIGPATEMGRIARLTAVAKPPPTPLQRRIGGLARVTAGIGVVITLVLGGAMLVQGSPLHEAFLVGVSVAVAAVPEGLSATVTIALAFGARAMAKRGAIVRRLAAVETLGSATVVATDKTGTLTESTLRLAALDPLAGVDESRLLQAALLASTARLVDAQGSVEIVGDPIDAALLQAALSRGVSLEQPGGNRTLLREVPFNSSRRRMTLVYSDSEGVYAYAKGAPEAILSRSMLGERERSCLNDRASDRARDGFRVVAVAERDLGTEDLLTDDEIETGFVPLGLVALHDPPRETAAPAIAAAHKAGLRVEMLTGDHRLTALAVGRSLGLPAEAVHARVTPEEKLRLVERRQTEGEVVAVTGDGVNDAPALRRADVGVAMGRSGTEAAREASDLVLTNDDFATIVAAIREGRTITDNIRKFVAFLLSANLGEVVMFTIAILAGLGAPMTVVQVLLVNVLTDGLPAVALARDPASPDTMSRPPARANDTTLPGGRLVCARIGGSVGGACRPRRVHPRTGRRRGAHTRIRNPRSRRARPRLLDAVAAWAFVASAPKPIPLRGGRLVARDCRPDAVPPLARRATRHGPPISGRARIDHRAGGHSGHRRRGAQGSRTPRPCPWGKPMKSLLNRVQRARAADIGRVEGLLTKAGFES
jgi:calcium-translocating P-type ATPase